MRKRYITLFIISVLLLVALQEFLRATNRAEAGANAGAQWIWSLPRGEHGAPTAVFAAKDFTLDFKPVRAEVEIAGDEEYQLLINGRGVAAGRYREQLDAYPVGRILRQGGNRIVVELRSARGVGGLLLRLHVDGANGERTTIVSDGSWRTMRRYVQGFSRPTSRSWGEPVRVWGTPPTGRWNAIGNVRRALTLRRLQGGKERRPQPSRRAMPLGRRWLTTGEYGGEPLGKWVTFDFGREKVGFVNLKFAAQYSENGLLFYGLHRPKDGIETPDEAIIRTPGRGHWTSSAPARFRYVTVVGAPQVTHAEVLEVVPQLAHDLMGRRQVEPLFGVDRRLTLVSPLEHEIRRKLQGVPGLAGREEG